ncbi:DUF2206 domain-containing protein [Methanosarcina sp.]|uniref:DUF2206 domain-containing protein n=1 Tax=Methanosarcina sp. TaxID=2213 RepID=UPI0029889E51|nr:DUF2206 domain-containing protein [Methanosarcina sp.]MDW5549185.1 DUF2206 domain-containing protein [Methanosarcina sp.]MDW5553109.1 DUF2206 domain-containing protein [Methanosarcina sp.]MDW5559365.1 DUF2206 domain-containing protein [Methanosarcina sp.]
MSDLLLEIIYETTIDIYTKLVGLYMMIINLLKATEWKFKTLFTIVLVIQISLCGLICLEAMNIVFPIVRQFIGFIYLTFIPGILIIRILKIRKLEAIDSLIYSLGFSIIFLMFTGFTINSLCPIIGINEPISEKVLILSIDILVLLLCLINYSQGETITKNPYIHLNKLFAPSTLILLSIPFLSIVGTYFVNFQNSNYFLMIMFVFIAILFMLAVNDKFISKDLYGFMIYLTAISLLFHMSLISMYIMGVDVHIEYYYANLVLSHKYWNPTIYENTNSMLSIVILLPIYSIICKLNLTWVIKIIYPLLFSFLPITMYSIYKKQIGEKYAFVSVFYFMAITTFYTEMLSLTRQQIAEILLGIIILTTISEEKTIKKRFMLLIFVYGLVVSHYGLTHLVLIFGTLTFLLKKYGLRSLSSESFRLLFILVFAVFVLSWDIYISSGSILATILSIFKWISITAGKEVLSTSSVNVITKPSEYYSGMVLKKLYLISQFFIFIGVSDVLYEKLIEKKKSNFSDDYLLFSILFLIVLASSLFTSSTGMNIHRLFHISSIILSPFVVIGYMTIVDFSKICFEKMSTNFHFLNPKFLLNTFSLILILFLLLNVGFIQELIKEEPKSYSLSQYRIHDNERLNDISVKFMNEFDFQSITWLANHRNKTLSIYADASTATLDFASYGGIIKGTNTLNSINNIIPENAYIYLNYMNIKYRLLNGPSMGIYMDIGNVTSLFDAKNMIYSNGNSIIYK